MRGVVVGRVVDPALVVAGPFDPALFGGIVGRTLLGVVPAIIRGWVAAEGVVLTEGEQEERS